MSTGLKQELGLGEPKPQGSTEQADKFKAAFQAVAAKINECLQYTAVYAQKAKHDPQAAKRDKTCQAYQVALGKIDPTNPSVAQGAIDQVMAGVQSVQSAVETLKQAVEKAYNAWTGRQGDFDAVTDKIREMVDWGHEKANALQQVIEAIVAKANERAYEEALKALEQLMGKIAPIYDEYQRQKAAQEEYEPALQSLQPRLDATKTCSYEALVPIQQELSAGEEQMCQAANAKDFVTALSQLRALETKVGEFENRLAEIEAKKQEYEQARSALDPKLAEASTSQYPALADMDQELADLTSRTDEAASAQDYDQAVTLVNELSTKVDEKLARVAEIEAKKQEYEQARAALDPKLAEASTSQYAALADMDQELADLTSRTDEAATAQDYEQAVTLVNELSTKVDEKLARVAEIEAKKQEYEQARAALDPKLAEASTSQYAVLAEMDQELADLTSRTDEAAAAEDYEQAVTLVNELSTKVDDKLARVAEIEAKKEEYEQARAALEPKLAEASTCEYASLAPMQEEIVNVQGQMEEAASSEDYEKAASLVATLATDVDSYLNAKKELQEKYRTLLAEAEAQVTRMNSHAQKAHYATEIAAAAGQVAAAKSKGDANALDEAIAALKQASSECFRLLTQMDLLDKGLDKARAEEVADVSKSLVDSGVDKEKALEVGQVMNKGGSGDVNDSKIVAAQIAELPLDVIKDLRANGTKVVACRDNITDYRTDLKGVQPRGWPAGSTWDTVPGVNLGDTNEVVIATRGHGTAAGAHVPKTGDGHGSYDLATHESMHAYDHNGSPDRHDDNDFKTAWNNDKSKLGNYYTQGGGAGQEEAFAESAARYYAGDPTLKTEWPNLYKYWEEVEKKKKNP